MATSNKCLKDTKAAIIDTLLITALVSFKHLLLVAIVLLIYSLLITPLVEDTKRVINSE
jgi:hypothetical protein